MPTYEYKCTACNKEKEVFQKITEESITECPFCGEETFMRKISGGFAVHFKGDGFYETDYKQKK